MPIVPKHVQREMGQKLAQLLTPLDQEQRVFFLVAALWGCAREKGWSAAQLTTLVHQQTELLEKGVDAARTRLVVPMDPVRR